MNTRHFLVVFTGLLCLALGAPADAQTTPIFGPKQYTRMTGPPQTLTETFPHCGTAPCQIVVVNGDADGGHRASTAKISVNGTQVVGPQDLNQRVARVVKPVTRMS